MKHRNALIMGGLAWSIGLSAQWVEPAFDLPFQNEVASVYITLSEASFDALFHPDSVWSDYEHPAGFVYQSLAWTDTVDQVGFRLRGNTSRTAGKKSFKVSFDRFDPDQQWLGLNKLNLNGEHNDVSMMRARNAHVFFNESGVPASRANHVKLFINGVYRGLYTNVEHIDGEWLESRIPHAHGNLWKCTYPANLHYNGPDGSDYQFTPSWSSTRVYDLKTNEAADDYQALAHFIDVLNNATLSDLPCALEDCFDVDSYLRAAAAEILVGHWDNYIGNQNNFYLYSRSQDGRLTYLPYDVDNTLGVQWFGNWIVQDPYDWTEAYRPLYTRLMQVPLYRDLFTWHLYDLLNDGFDGDTFEARSSSWQAMAVEAAAQDTYYPADYGFGFDDWQASIGSNYGLHIPYGIVPYVNGRASSALNQLDAFAPHPGWVIGWAMGPVVNGLLTVEARVGGDATEVTAWVESDGAAATAWTMVDLDGDGLYQTEVPTEGSTAIAFQVTAAFGNGAERTSPCEPSLVWTSQAPSAVRLNEVMPLNNSFLQDEWGGFADWAEITVTEAASLEGLYLTNRLSEPQRWPLPSLTLQAGDHLLIWCDDDALEGDLHAPFNLDASGDDLFLMEIDNSQPRVVDMISWAELPPNVSLARLPDATGPWSPCAAGSEVPPTPGAENVAPTQVSATLAGFSRHAPFPNPVRRGETCMLSDAVSGALHDSSGKLLMHFDGQKLDTSALSSGWYLVRWTDPIGKTHQHPIAVH